MLLKLFSTFCLIVVVRCYMELHFIDNDTKNKVCKADFIKDEHLDKFIACEKEFRDLQDKIGEEYKAGQQTCLDKLNDKLTPYSGVTSKEGQSVILHACYFDEFLQCIDENSKLYIESHKKLRNCERHSVGLGDASD